MSEEGAVSDFALQLRQRRLSGGLTQEQLAERAGLSVRAISDLERGLKTPQRTTVQLLARALALSAEDARTFARASQRDRVHPDGSVRRSSGPAQNLPIPLTNFVGRQQQVAEVARLLGSSRLLTLTGAGGCGKTRLALAVAEVVRPAFADGVCFVDLAPLGEEAAVVPAMLTALGLVEKAGASETALLARLRDRKMLLLLDNCEHLLDTCATVVERVLHACPGVRLLVTSREPLGAAGEAIYRVPSLSLPDPARQLDLAAALASEAVQLLTARATLVQPDLAVDERTVAAVVAICRRLDGIPLAIELAAARLRVLAPEQLLARLDDRFRLLVGGRTALRRQQTLRATMDWSYDLLAEPERRLFRRLAVFIGGCTLEAAEAVGSGDDLPADGVLDLLTALVDKSLVQAETGGPEARYRLLETIRQYAEEALLASGEAAATRDQHVRYFLERAEREPDFMTVYLDLNNENSTWGERERPNLMSAIDWAERRAGDDGAPALPTDAALFLHSRLPWDERFPLGGTIARLRGLLDMHDNLTYLGPATPARGSALAKLAHAYNHTGDPVARTIAEQAVTVLRAVGNARTQARGLGVLCHAAYSQGDSTTARAAADEAVAIARGLDNHDEARVLAGHMLFVRSNAARRAGDITAARTDAEESIALFRAAAGPPQALAWSLGSLGFIAEEDGDPAAARRVFVESLATVNPTAYPINGARSLSGLAGVALLERDAVRAARLFAAAEAAREPLDVRLGAADRRTVERQLAMVRAQLGPAAFAAAWEQGRATPLEQAIAEALGDTAGSEEEGASRSPGPHPHILTI